MSLFTLAVALSACSAPAPSRPEPGAAAGAAATPSTGPSTVPSTVPSTTPSAGPGEAERRPAVDLTAYEAGRSRPVADPLYPAYGNPSIDVLHYDLALDWKPRARTITGTATLTIRAARPIDRVRLDFGRALTVDRVAVGDAEARATRAGDDLTVRLPERLRADQGVEVTVRYHGRPRPVNARQKREDISMLGFHVGRGGAAWALQEPFGSFTWFPVNDHPSDEALYDVAITVPEGWSGVAHGTYEGRSTAGGRSTFRWRSTHPVASYLTVFAADRFRMYRDKGPRGIPITYWVRPADVPRQLPVMRRMPAIVRWLEKKLGPYPFPSAGLVATSDSGMETQEMVTLGPRYMRPEVVAHELAHHWFGNTVTPRTWRDLWLNEGFAMYLEMQWFADHEGGTIDQLVANIRRHDPGLRAESGPPGRYRRDSFGQSNVYYGPAIMLHEIRKRLGDRRFFATLRTWVQEHRDTTQDRRAFVTWLNEETGEDFTELVNAWLDSRTTPR
ncbi:MAG TPA: M1 family metallopeptidase [Nonomuraea sp.]|nr:M1 family metallopeptidase [Nonomuraea sp.]